MNDDSDLYEGLRAELRRGSLSLAVLARLRVERYGYTLRQALAEDGLDMEESTSIRCCAGWSHKGFWSANGAKRKSAKSVFTSSLRRVKSCWSGSSANGGPSVPRLKK